MFLFLGVVNKVDAEISKRVFGEVEFTVFTWEFDYQCLFFNRFFSVDCESCRRVVYHSATLLKLRPDLLLEFLSLRLGLQDKSYFYEQFGIVPFFSSIFPHLKIRAP